MKVTGKYTKDKNFTTVFSNNTMYTISRVTGDWGYLRVGDQSYMGQTLTQEYYDELMGECNTEGEFELQE